MDCRYLETEVNLKNDLITFTKQNLPTTKAETDLGTKFEYTDKFIDFIVKKSFEQAKEIKEFPEIMQNLIAERKQQLIINSSKAADVVFEGHLNQVPLCIDYDEKRGTLLKHNNRTLSKYLEKVNVNVLIKNIRAESENNDKSNKNKIN